MIFQGRILKILPLQTGQTKDGKEWRKQEFVFEFFENPTDRWSDKVVLSLMGENIDKHNIAEGDEVRIGFGHSVREYDGKVYNELRLYRLEKLASAPNSAPQAMQAAPTGNQPTESETSAQGAKNEDDLPF